MPAADVEIVAAEREDGSRAGVPVLRFAYLRRLLERWRGVPTLLLNGTGDPEIYRRVWPETEVSSYHAMTWAGQVFWIPDAGFGKSRMMGPDEELTARGEEVGVLFRFLDRYALGGAALVTHMAAEKQIAKVAGEEASTGHHGAVLGLDRCEGGSRLSGGQRQRISIARAMLTDAPILLLDEATSALDSESEAKVQEAMERLKGGRTTLVIAHRLSTVRHADRIHVIDRGLVAENGKHEELLARGGLFARFHEIQLQPEGPAVPDIAEEEAAMPEGRGAVGGPPSRRSVGA